MLGMGRDKTQGGVIQVQIHWVSVGKAKGSAIENLEIKPARKPWFKNQNPVNPRGKRDTFQLSGREA
ncbi:hypothetical protein EPR50_G00043230 [Perca flavescens]|uniref:Uncharacterized protein n=1 Tax=Perca flavescens TaxID=8167 RepID=A0A484DHG6_PERFV|nr:hypothetical protein EPR50_G00043230 [Perca flavescens]